MAGPTLRAAGHAVVGLDTDLFRGCEFGDPAAEIAGIQKDIRDLTKADLAGFEAVVHLAALSNDPLGNLDPDLTHEINHRATIRMAQHAKEAGVRRFVFSSSCSAYGAAGDAVHDEAAPLAPVTAYAKSKVLCERELATMADQNFSPVFLRNATAYGVSPRLRLDLVLNDLVASAYTTGKVLIKSDGTPWRPLVHVRDITAAILSVLEAPRTAVHNQTFNVGKTEENYRISELASIVEDTVPGCRVEYAAGGGPDKRCYRIDCRKILRVLPGFQPNWNARKGVEELYEAYKSIGLTSDQCRRYVRIEHIQNLMEVQALDNTLRWTRQASHVVVG